MPPKMQAKATEEIAHALMIRPPFLIRDYAPTLATAVKKRFWGPLSPSLIPKTFLFLSPNCLLEA
jgi:hypothetical protein